ncbi:MAG: insulinase family protein [Deltaproteobacteria bacterium]
MHVHSTGQLVRATLLAGALSVLASGCKPAASPGNANPDLLARDPAVHEEVLDSGVTYISQRGQSERGLVNLRLVVRAGTGSEREQERGFAHLIEHLAFSGTEHFPKEELRQFIGWQGLTINRHTSGITAFAYTVYDSNAVRIELRSWFQYGVVTHRAPINAYGTYGNNTDSFGDVQK